MSIRDLFEKLYGKENREELDPDWFLNPKPKIPEEYFPEDYDDGEDADYGEFAYDHYGNEVTCKCGELIHFKLEEGGYYCPYCEEHYSRDQFFAMIGDIDIEDKCRTCNGNYTDCEDHCPY